eukprot:3931618-Rhodomonas_salina.1
MASPTYSPATSPLAPGSNSNTHQPPPTTGLATVCKKSWRWSCRLSQAPCMHSNCWPLFRAHASEAKPRHLSALG